MNAYILYLYIDNEVYGCMYIMYYADVALNMAFAMVCHVMPY